MGHSTTRFRADDFAAPRRSGNAHKAVKAAGGDDAAKPLLPNTKHGSDHSAGSAKKTTLDKNNSVRNSSRDRSLTLAHTVCSLTLAQLHPDVIARGEARLNK